MNTIKKLITNIILLLAIPIVVWGQSNPDFDAIFHNKTLRFDYYHSGNNKTDYYTFDEMIEEPYWGGSKTVLIDPNDYGHYKFEIKNSKGEILYSRGYSALFPEWQSTEEAKTVSRTYSESVVFPFPKIPVTLEIYCRNHDGKWQSRFTHAINPDDYFIVKERKYNYPAFKVADQGDPAKKLDIVVIPEGYTAAEMDKFHKDCERFANFIFKCAPFDTHKSAINIWGVEAPSLESGTDYPGSGKWQNTLLNSRFYTFDIERYLMTSDYKMVRNIASNAPYDQIFILVNNNHYGGGGIYNYYAISTVDNIASAFVCIHEFGHSFAALGDEYYDAGLGSESMYNLSIEPWEPNLTTLVNFDTKWKSMVDKKTPIPTPAEVKYKEVTGAFEGGGYLEKGIYRPALDCSMKSGRYNNFCPVCRKAISDMMQLYIK